MSGPEQAGGVIFEWQEIDYQSLLRTCATDEVGTYIFKYFTTSDKLLESGSGTGRWVRYLHDKGYRIAGLELSPETVRETRKRWPDLDIVQGNCENSPFPANTFDGVISLGVVEHWADGPDRPLADILRILKPGSIAIITVPCLNKIREIKKKLFLGELAQVPRALLRLLVRRRRSTLFRCNRRFKYAVHPPLGSFFEYRMKPEEFRYELEKAGFQIIEHVPSSGTWGIYYELNPFGMLVACDNWKLTPSKIAQSLEKRWSKRPFTYEHMQIAIVRKPEASQSVIAGSEQRELT
jgi:SAM-dependent methyltransferase